MTLDHQHLRRLAEGLISGPFRITHESQKDKVTGQEKPTGRATIAQDKPGGIMVAYTTSDVAQFLADCDKTKILHLLDTIDQQKATIDKLRAALKYYADEEHFIYGGSSEHEPENPTGEPSNIYCGGADGSEFTFEDGSIARAALAELELRNESVRGDE